MKLIKNNFLITADENENKKLVAGDKELYVDTDFNPYRYATKEGTVAYIPEICDIDHGLKEGDKVLLHHFVCQKENELTIHGKKYFLAKPMQIFASVNNNKVIPIADYLFVEPITQEIRKEGNFQLDTAEKVVEKRGIVTYISEKAKEEGIKIGDEVYITKNARYKVTVNNIVYYKISIRNIRIIKRGEEIVPLKNTIILKDGNKVFKKGLGVDVVDINDTVSFYRGYESNVLIGKENYTSIKKDNLLWKKS